jgi:hypothetical protein
MLTPENEQDPPSVPGHHEGPGGGEDVTPNDHEASGHHPSYREISWSGLFGHFLDSRQKPREDLVDKCSITYLGESFPLSLVLEDLQEGGNLRLHHPGPPLGDASSSPEGNSQRGHPSHLLPEDMNCLLSKKAFDYPDRATYDALMSTFLDTFFPLYPIVNRAEFIEQYKRDSLPWILLQSCCFIGATFCPEAILHRAGYSGRRAARFSFYRKAKALFDTGYESNKIVILQSVIMLSFWGGAPNTYWNFYSWISTGVTLAETLGIHRSLRNSNMHAKDAALLKRIWWVLMVRDAFCATLVGRPFRINTDMGDAEMLSITDFEHDHPSMNAQHPLKDQYGLYQIEIAKLALVLRQIVYTRWLPGRMKYASDVLNNSLAEWKQDINPLLDWERASSDNALAQALSILYDHHIILANLGCPPPEAGQSPVDLATQRISATASSLVLRSQTLHVPHETFQGLFITGVASYTRLRSPESASAQLGRSIINNCQMILRSAHDNWDAAPWTMELIEKLLKVPQRTSDVTEGQIQPFESLAIDWTDFDAFNTIDVGVSSPWQANPTLYGLFDFGQTEMSFMGLQQDSAIIG